MYLNKLESNDARNSKVQSKEFESLYEFVEC